MKNFLNPWSETLVFIGAGATASLGMPQTDTQSKFFRKLAASENRLPLPKIFLGFDEKDLLQMENFLAILGDGKCLDDDRFSVSESELAAAKKAFRLPASDSIYRNRIRELRDEYDWIGLKAVIGICPQHKIRDNLVRDIYTLLDKKISAHQGIKVAFQNGEEFIVESSRLLKVRNCLVLFTNILFANAWYRLSKGKCALDFAKYVALAETLSRMMQREGARLCSEGCDFSFPAFYRFSYSVVSLNFETVFLWLLFNAHRKANQSGFFLSRTAQAMKLWLDFGIPSKSRKIKTDAAAREPSNFSYSVSETAIFRGNECFAQGAPVGRIGKFLFAHGCSLWRECPVCGRMMYYLGDRWGFSDAHANAPLPIPLFENDDFNRTEKEKKWRKEKLHFDSLECVSCGAETFASSAPMVMQTMVKGNPTSFLEEVQRESRVLMDKARHFVLLGYQLPSDDSLWVETFAETVRYRMCSEAKAYCTVVVGFKGEERFLYGAEMLAYVDAHRKEKDADAYGVTAIDNAVSIFGREQVRAYTGGIPNVFGSCTESEIGEVFFPTDFVDWNGTRLEK